MTGAELGFHAADAAKLPGGGEELAEQGELEFALGMDIDLELDLQRFEFILVFVGNETILGAQAGVREFCGEAAFPAGVWGPVLWRALARLAARFLREIISGFLE